MRFPDEDAYRYAGGLKRLWYKIICPFTFGSRLWMVKGQMILYQRRFNPPAYL